MTPTGNAGGSPSVGGIVLFFAAFAVIGGPLVFVIWETINYVLAGDFGAVRLGLFLPALVAFAALLYALGRVLRRWSAEA